MGRRGEALLLVAKCSRAMVCSVVLEHRKSLYSFLTQLKGVYLRFISTYSHCLSSSHHVALWIVQCTASYDLYGQTVKYPTCSPSWWPPLRSLATKSCCLSVMLACCLIACLYCVSCVSIFLSHIGVSRQFRAQDIFLFSVQHSTQWKSGPFMNSRALQLIRNHSFWV